MAKNKVKPVNLHIFNARLSFPSLHEPTKSAEGDALPKYRATFLLDPKDPKHKDFIQTLKGDFERAIREQFGTRPANLKPFSETFGEGNTQVSNQTGEVYDGYEGMFYFKARSTPDYPPKCLDKFGNKLSKEQIAEVFYPGCRVHAIVYAWGQENQFGKAIRYTLGGVKFAGDDERFGNGGVSDSAFDVFGDDAPHFDASDFG